MIVMHDTWINYLAILHYFITLIKNIAAISIEQQNAQTI